MLALGLPAAPVRPRVVDLARASGVAYHRVYRAVNGGCDLTPDEENRLRKAIQSFGQQIQK